MDDVRYQLLSAAQRFLAGPTHPGEETNGRGAKRQPEGIVLDDGSRPARVSLHVIRAGRLLAALGDQAFDLPGQDAPRLGDAVADPRLDVRFVGAGVSPLAYASTGLLDLPLYDFWALVFTHSMSSLMVC